MTERIIRFEFDFERVFTQAAKNIRATVFIRIESANEKRDVFLASFESWLTVCAWRFATSKLVISFEWEFRFRSGTIQVGISKRLPLLKIGTLVNRFAAVGIIKVISGFGETFDRDAPV